MKERGRSFSGPGEEGQETDIHMEKTKEMSIRIKIGRAEKGNEEGVGG